MILIVQDLGCAYRLVDDTLEWAPLFNDGTIDTENWGPVEPDLVGEETVEYNGRECTLYDVFDDVITRLNA